MSIEANVLAEINRILHSELSVEREALPADDILRDLQLDSIGVMTLVMGLEDHFKVALEEQDASEVRTIGDLVDLVARRASAPDQEHA